MLWSRFFVDSDQLYALYQQQPKPVTSDQCLAIAQANLDAIQFSQYSKWWAVNGQTVMRNLNA